METTIVDQSPQTTMRALLEAGVHFGHQTKRWNPKMKPYIYGERNGIHLIDLDQTLGYLNEAFGFVSDITGDGGKVLFVGTKKQAQDVVAREAARAGQFYVNRRWLGGTLTNFSTIRQRLRLLKELQAQDASGEFEVLPKQEAAKKRDELERLERTLGGMRDMTQLPAALFIVDPRREQLAVKEARKLGIPVIAIADTNADPDVIDYIIPGNDDAIRALRLLTAGIADASLQGMMRQESFYAEDAGMAEEASAESGAWASAEGEEQAEPPVVSDETGEETDNGEPASEA